MDTLTLSVEKDGNVWGVKVPPVRLRFSTNKNGAGSLVASYPLSFTESLIFQERWIMADVSVNAKGGELLWRGRLEDIAVERKGVSLTAFGYARAFGDVLYTGLWSKDTSAEFRPVLESEVSNIKPERFQLDNNNRVYLAVKKDHTSNDDNRGAMVYELPDKGVNDVAQLTFDYTIVGTGSGGGAKEYRLRAAGLNTSWTGVTAATYTVADNTPVSGSGSITMGAGVQKVFFSWGKNGATDGHFTGTDTGDEAYAVITNIRIKAKTGTVLSSDIAAGLLAYVNSANPSQIDSATVGIVPTSTDLRGMIFEDKNPNDILDLLCDIDGYRWRVWDKSLVYEPNNTEQQTYYIDAETVEVQRSLDSVASRAYAVYQTEGSRKLRTAVASNLNAVTAFGISRDVVTNAQTTSATEAEFWRDTLLSDKANLSVRAQVRFNKLLSTTGQVVPLWSIRAGDRIVVRNVPLDIRPALEVRSFIVAQTDFDAVANSVAVEPDVPYPTMVTLISRRGKTQ
jgi:hypothetical protein